MAVEADVETLVAATVERFGRLECAFNNAGIEWRRQTPSFTTREMGEPNGPLRRRRRAQ